MKICWDSLENIRLTKSGNFRNILTKQSYHYMESCKKCGCSFIGKKKYNKYCSVSCASGSRKHSEEAKKKMSEIKMGENNYFYGKHHSEKTKHIISKKIKDIFKNPENNPFYGKNHNKESKRKISLSKDISCKYPEEYVGGYKSDDIPLYDTYASQINWCESTRRNKVDRNILEVKCAYCGRWFVPSLTSVRNRISCLKYLKGYRGEQRLYCSDSCKFECPIYNKTPETLMKEDAVRSGRLSWLEIGREVQPELRQMVFERDNYECQKCGSTEHLHCHHIEGIRWNPLESADIDICVTLCKHCHIEVHKISGCSNYDMKCNNI